MNIYGFTLNIPDIDNVKLDVYDSNINSLTSIANAINAPAVILVAKITASGDNNPVDDGSDSFNNSSPSIIANFHLSHQ